MDSILQLDCEITRECIERCIASGDSIIVAEQGAQVVGYIICKKKENGFYCSHIFVHPKHRRRKIGSRLVNFFLDRLSPYSKSHITVKEFCETNLAAQLFWRSCGFKMVEILKRYFRVKKKDERDAYVFQYRATF